MVLTKTQVQHTDPAAAVVCTSFECKRAVVRNGGFKWSLKHGEVVRRDSDQIIHDSRVVGRSNTTKKLRKLDQKVEKARSSRGKGMRISITFFHVGLLFRTLCSVCGCFFFLKKLTITSPFYSGTVARFCWEYRPFFYFYFISFCWLSLPNFSCSYRRFGSFVCGRHFCCVLNFGEYSMLCNRHWIFGFFFLNWKFAVSWNVAVLSEMKIYYLKANFIWKDYSHIIWLDLVKKWLFQYLKIKMIGFLIL